MFFDTDYWLTRLVFQRLLAAIYLIGFIVIVNQFIPLCGAKGLMPANAFLKRVPFWDSPSLFWISSSDRFMLVVGWLGVLLAALAVTGISDAHGLYLSVIVWGLLWMIYLSFVNVGQTFYGFGWESLLLEAGFLTIFFGSSDTKVPVLVVWLLRWLLFRLMFGAGLIKMRGDSCWRDLTCMMFHYQTQPLPNPLSWYFNYLPKSILKGAVLFNHFAELLLPFAYFVRGNVAAVAGIITIIFQALLIVSGNFSWLNYLTVVLAVTCLNDRWLTFLPISRPSELAEFTIHQYGVFGLTSLVIVLSIGPTMNLFSRSQRMNASFDPLHLVNTYGAFGSITKVRREIIVEGLEEFKGKQEWKEYAFKAKPGDIYRTPPLIAPYHLRLDWMMWFAAMSPYQYSPWFITLMQQLLHNDAGALSLLGKNDFPTPPVAVRASLYEYRYTTPAEKAVDGAVWHRTFLGLFCPVMTQNAGTP